MQGIVGAKESEKTFVHFAKCEKLTEASSFLLNKVIINVAKPARLLCFMGLLG